MTANSHLSDNEMAELIAGNASQTMLAHLQICDDCSLEARDLREAVLALRESLSAIAARPRTKAQQASPGWGLRAAAAAMAVLLLVSGGLVLDRKSGGVMERPAGVEMSEAELLNQVQVELSSDVPAALEPAAYLTQERQQILNSGKNNRR
ncbi:MAG TPA: hypothetical protein VE998_08320 [Terriglobales bacterium]|nr:hypothetical protein [Terriglobales bacterium]